MTSITEKHNNSGKKLKLKFCRDQKVQNLIMFLSSKYGIYFDPFISVKNARVRDCPDGHNCSKAHHIDELDIKEHINNLENRDMKDFNAVDGYLNMIKVLKKCIKKVSPEDRALIKKVLKNDVFIEILNLWIDLSVRYHRIKNDLRDDAKQKGLKNFKRNRWRSDKPPSNSSSYQFPGDVPTFHFDNEDVWWAIHRKFNMCMKAEMCRSKVSKILEEFRAAKIKISKNYKKNKSKHKLEELLQFALNDIKKNNKLYIYNMCELETNCKYGVHLKKDQICLQDFIEGKCDCKNKDLHIKLNDLENNIKKLDKSSLEYKKMNKKILKLTSECKRIMIHYTDIGMTPISKQIIDYKNSLKANEKKKKDIVNEEKTKIEENVEKLDWDF